jgi:MFS transporter, DHA1 family, multidrug resistance protein
MADRAAPAETTGTGRGPGMREFVILMAALMASNALAIDAMLPALPAIGEALDVADENRRQLVITAYLIGFGLAQLVYGPVSDRVGRKPILVVTLLLYAAFALLCGIASSFNLLLAARFLQGVAAAGTRVLVVSIIRDRFAGERMAKVMSLVFIIFMVVPVLAPAFGTIVLAVATWRAIFIGLAVYGAVVLAWSWLRLPETLHPEHRRALSTAAIGEAALLTLTNRQSIGNTVASTLIFGGLFAFINSVQQIVFDVFDRPDLLALVFACIAGPMAFSSWMNSRLVERIGARRLALGAMVTFTIVSATHLALALALTESLALFVVMQALTMMTFGLIGANLGSIAMAPLGHSAGTASSVQGLIGTVGGALIGAAVGQAFDGTQIPFLIGLVLCGISALAVAIYANPPLAQGGKDIAGT